MHLSTLISTTILAIYLHHYSHLLISITIPHTLHPHCTWTPIGFIHFGPGIILPSTTHHIINFVNFSSSFDMSVILRKAAHSHSGSSSSSPRKEGISLVPHLCPSSSLLNQHISLLLLHDLINKKIPYHCPRHTKY